MTIDSKIAEAKNGGGQMKTSGLFLTSQLVGIALLLREMAMRSFKECN